MSPIIDVIAEDDFEYVPASDMTWGGFNWKLNFRWFVAFLMCDAFRKCFSLIKGIGCQSENCIGEMVTEPFLCG